MLKIQYVNVVSMYVLDLCLACRSNSFHTSAAATQNTVKDLNKEEPSMKPFLFPIELI